MARLLFLCLCLPAPAFADAVPNEWIAPRGAWMDALPRGVAVRPLDARYVWIRGALPKGARGAQPNYRYRAFTDPDLGKSWGLVNSGQAVDTLAPGIAGADVGAASAWAIHQGSRDAVVAILDSGLDLRHEELRENLWVNPHEMAGNGRDDDGNGFVDDVHGWNFVDGNADVSDRNGHGTLCAGIVGAEAGNHKGSRGVNARVSLMAVKSLDDAGVGTTAAAIAAIDYAVRQGAHVINASWGGTVYDPALYDAVRRAGEAGVLFVAAAGNHGRNNDTARDRVYPASFRLPALVSVAAYDNRDTLATFSNYGKETVHLGAPGVAIYSTIPGDYRFAEGTSFAAPFVSGAAALLKSFVPSLGAREIKERLLATTEVIHYYEKERVATGGRLNLFNLLRDVRPPRPAVPPAWERRPYSGGTPHPYANKQSYRFTVEAPGASHVRVHFTGFRTEACCDIVRLYDGRGRWIAAYSGDLGDFWSADALGDRLTVELTADYSVPEHGFDIDALEAAP